VSPREGSPVPCELLPPHIGRCQSSATSVYQPPPSRRTTTSSQHARPFGILCRWSDGLECTAWRPLRPVAQYWQFQEDDKDASVSECTWTLSALEALRNALYKYKPCLLTYMLLIHEVFVTLFCFVDWYSSVKLMFQNSTGGVLGSCWRTVDTSAWWRATWYC